MSVSVACDQYYKCHVHKLFDVLEPNRLEKSCAKALVVTTYQIVCTEIKEVRPGKSSSNDRKKENSGPKIQRESAKQRKQASHTTQNFATAVQCIFVRSCRNKPKSIL